MPDRSGTGRAAVHSVRVENPWLAEEAWGYSDRSTTNAAACGAHDDSKLHCDYEKRRMKNLLLQDTENEFQWDGDKM